MGRSLADLLDAQEKRGGGAYGSGRRASRWRDEGPPSPRDRQDLSRRADRTSNPSASGPPTSSRWANVDLSSSRNHGRSSYNHRSARGRGRPIEFEGPASRSCDIPYEERRARIEQDAFEASERAASRSATCDNNNGQDEPDDDISTWIGPPVDDELTGERRCTYFQDRDKQYPFYTSERGYDLLQELMRKNAALLVLNRERIEEEAVASALAAQSSSSCGGSDIKAYSADVIVRIGKGLYAHKPTLRTKGVTWSTEEYTHPGLQRMYLRMKSIQRFTEIWALLERADSIGVFDRVYERGSGTVRIAAIGGGPGYELLAARLYFRDKCPGIELELICMDICEAWRPCAERLGFRFVQYDIADENTDPLAAAGMERGDLDFCIISCVMIYCTTKKTMKMFHDLLHEGGVNAALVSERGETTKACTMFEGLGGSVIRLIDQSYGVDERQAIWCSDEFHDANQLRRPDFSRDVRPTFPNVPYEEHKHKRRCQVKHW